MPMEFIKEIDRKIQFENVLSEICDTFILLKNDNIDHSINEYVYGVILNRGKENERRFKIYSSISIYDNKFRSYGSDAIRILPWGNKKPIGKSIRVNRTPNWHKNLIKKVLNFKHNDANLT